MGYPKVKRGDKAKRPHSGLRLDKATLLQLIPECRGNISKVADTIGCTRKAIRSCCDADPELNDCLVDARERRIDILEQCVYDRAEESNDTALQCFILKTQGRHRGWEQDDVKTHTREITMAAFDFIQNRSKNPAEPKQGAEAPKAIEGA